MKTDYDLGKKVGEHLVSLGIETPMVPYDTPHEVKLRTISNAIHECMTVLGLDLTDDSLMDTPNRVAKMWVNEIYSGLDYANFPKVTTIENKMKYDEMVLVSGITANSSCEHHLITVDQTVHIAYIPKDRVIGLSKLSRIAKFFGQRPEVQERYCAQVFETLKFILETEDVAVSVIGKHYCMIGRGVEDINAVTTTNKFGGCFKENPASRAEFIQSIRG
jgi:GTP cyclohydrolase IA